MLFPDPPRRRPSENLLPMINVVFLLLIFFLLAAKIAPPTPFEMTPPEASGDPAVPGEEPVLWLGPEGEIALGAARGDTALEALAAVRAACSEDCDWLLLRADAGAAADALARLMPRLAAMGYARVSLVTLGTPQ